jgi:isochorismate synthase
VADFLAYRFPGKDIVHSSGEFQLLDQISDDLDSFVLSDFRGDKMYSFHEFEKLSSTPPEKWFFSSDIPKVIDYPGYMRNAVLFLKVLSEFGLKKIVFSRVKSVDFDHGKILQFFENLCHTYPNAFVYLASSPLFGTWIGATPEILLEIHGKHVFTMSLAGTKTFDSEEEWNQKEVEEQQYVTDFILDTLRDHGIKETELNGPYPFEAGPVKHLRTDISFDLGNRTGIELASALHPTPAVSGLPQQLAIEVIEAIEKHDLKYDRFLYAGFLGKISPNQTKLFVNLRCCQIIENKAYIYVGGGFTKDSVPETEWQETERKSRTLLSVIQGIK